MLVDIIKTAVDKACKSLVVSCADILAIAARDYVSILRGPSYWYEVRLGRRDSRNAIKKDAEFHLPSQHFNYSQLVSNFKFQGLNLKYLVALSGSHTICLARCSSRDSKAFAIDFRVSHSLTWQAGGSQRVVGRSGGGNGSPAAIPLLLHPMAKN
ncbi:hypothetical protein KIW84_054223 [Lathyrus oleraceus]|uniref:peroxidase n=1 Tax=Pisum sativum TaxID=3888 RepID=A0A9D4WSJ4_PEA|nr:hypothetical protein KIW84_054223 [Pisum sativum]